MSAVALAAGALLLSGCTGAESSPYAAISTISGTASPYKGTYINQPYVLPAATWKDTAGAKVAWPASGLAHPVEIVFFAYSHCPDVCGTQLADAARAIRDLPADVKARVGLTMVTVDPQRDDAQTLRSYLDRFNPEFVGLRSDDTAMLGTAAEALGVALDSGTKTKYGYEVAHGAQLIGFGPSGTAPVIWLPGSAPRDITADLITLSAQN